MNTLQTLEAAKTNVSHALGHHIDAYCNGMTLRQLHNDLERKFLFLLGTNPAAEPLKIHRSNSHVLGLIRSREFVEFAALKTALAVNEASTQFIEAFEILQPLIDRVNELEEQLASEADMVSKANQALREAEEAARTQAEAKLASNPAIVKAREALETLTASLAPTPPAEPAPLVRGKITTRPSLDLIPA